MRRRGGSPVQRPPGTRLLRRLEEAEQTLEAIRTGQVDAVVVAGPDGDHVFTLKGADFAYRVMVERMSEGAATADLHGTILYSNRRFSEMLGLPPERVVGASLDRFLPEARRRDVAEVLAKGAAGFARAEIELTRRDGDPVPVQLSVGSLPNPDVPAVSIIATDLSAEKKRQARESSEQLARSILEQAAEAIVVCDSKERILRSSKGAESLCACAPLGRRFSELFPIERGGSPAPSLVEGCREGRVLRGLEVAIRRKDGAAFDLMASASPLMSPDGEFLGCVITMSDITERKRLEGEIKALNQELESRVADRTAALNELISELQSFNYSVSHDLRGPLRRITAFSQLLIEQHAGDLDERGKDYCRRIRASAERMGEILDAILSLSRMSLSELRVEDVDLAAMGWAIIDDLKGAEPQRRVSFQASAGLRARGDRELLRLALQNLIGNAWKFTSGRPHAHIEMGRVEQGGETVFFIRDDGVGFDPAFHEKLFEPFQRLHAEEEFPGTGIGLTVAQRVFRRHGGRIWAEGAPDRGATIYFTLRTCEEHAEEG